MMRVLITGATGFVGSHLIDYLIEHTDWNIYGMCRWRSPLINIQQHLGRIEKGDRLHLVYGDLKDAGSLRDIVERVLPNYVFHLAAQSFPRTSFDSPIDTYDTNILGTCRLLDVLRDAFIKDCQIHVCASSEVFGRVSKEELPIKEDCRFHPASPYAISKVGTDLIGRFYAEAYGMNVQTTRLFSHTGPRRGDVFVESSFAKQIAMIERGMIVPVIKVGNLNSMRTWMDVRDVVKSYHLLLTKDPQAGAYYNIGGDYSCTVGEMLDTLIQMSPIRPEIVEDPARLRPIDADLQIPDSSKFRDHTGWKPTIPFKQTMKDLLDYWRQQAVRQTPVLWR